MLIQQVQWKRQRRRQLLEQWELFQLDGTVGVGGEHEYEGSLPTRAFVGLSSGLKKAKTPA